MSVVDTLTGITEGALYQLPVDRVRPSDDNVRAALGDLDGLAASIVEHGLVQPIVVHPHPDDDGTFEIVAGHRRHAAHLQAGLDTIDAIVRLRTDDGGAQDTAARIVENVQRQDLTVADEARAYARLADLGWSQRKIATAVGVTQGHVSKRIRLTVVPDDLLDAVDADDSDVHVEDVLDLARLTDRDADAAGEIIDGWRKDRNPWVLNQTKGVLVRLDREAERRKALDELHRLHAAGDGLPVIEDLDDDHTLVNGYWYERRGVDRDQLQADGTLAVTVNRFGDVQQVCTDPDRYPPPATADGAPAPRGAFDEARQARREHIRTLTLTGSTWAPPAGADLLVEVILELLVRVSNSTQLHAVLDMLHVAVNKSASKGDLEDAIHHAIMGHDRDSPDYVVARAVAQFLLWERVEWSMGSFHRDPSDRQRAYLEQLIAAGYEPTDVESEWLAGVDEEDA